MGTVSPSTTTTVADPLQTHRDVLTAAGLWGTAPGVGVVTGSDCPRCHAPLLRGENHAGISTRLDPAALDPIGELTAVLTGRLTYRLWSSAPRTLVATRRWAPDITTHPASPTATPAHLRSGPPGTPALVVATHRCRQPLSTHPLPLAPAGDATALPDQPTF